MNESKVKNMSNKTGVVTYSKPAGEREVLYAADIGHYLYKDSMGNMFPSKVSKVKPFGSKANCIKLNGVEYFIGEGEYEINIIKYDKENYMPLLLSGICNAFKDKEYIIVKLGLLLPLNQYEESKNNLIKMLEDTTHHVVFNGKPVVVEITTVEVYPEGICAFQSVNSKYEDRIGSRDVIVVDIGGGTTDICLVRDNVVIKRISVDYGTIHIYDIIRKAISRKYIDVKIDLEKVRHYIMNGFYYEGEEVDISFAINEASHIFHIILNELRLNYPITSELTLLMGGGSELLADTFEDYIVDMIVDDNLFANVEGCFEFLRDEE